MWGIGGLQIIRNEKTNIKWPSNDKSIFFFFFQTQKEICSRLCSVANTYMAINTFFHSYFMNIQKRGDRKKILKWAS